MNVYTQGKGMLESLYACLYKIVSIITYIRVGSNVDIVCVIQH